LALKKPEKEDFNRTRLESYRIVRKYIKKFYSCDSVAKKSLDRLQVYVESYTSNMAAATNPESGELFINMDIMWQNIDNLEKVVMHEFVHVYLFHKTKNLGDHDEEFKNEMLNLGFNGAIVRHDFLPAYEFVYKCKKCSDRLVLHERIGDDGICLNCGGENFSFKVKRMR
jgi:predicted SprT family Zn-dependent metalloprotease